MTYQMRELSYRTAYAGERGLRYSVSGGLPWYRETETYPNQFAAWDAAVSWAKDYRARDTFGNMAHALGFVRKADGWCGVINYYHSNT